MEDAAQESEQRYRELFERSPVAMWEQDFRAVGAWLDSLRMTGVKNLRGYLDAHPEELLRGIGLVRILDVNPAGVAFIGAEDKQQFLNGFPQEVLTEDVRQSFVDQFEAIWEERDRFEIELTGSTLGGDRIDCILHWAAHRVGGRLDLSRVVIAITDITKRKEAEKARQMAEQLFESAFEHAPIGMALTKPDGRFLRTNQAFCDLLGYSEKDLRSKSWQDITHPEDLEVSQHAVNRALVGEIDTLEMEKRYLGADGRMVWGRVGACLLRDADGSPFNAIAQVVDITEQKATQERLEELVRSKDEFIASVSHELRTPLTAVVGFAELLRMGQSDLSPAEREESIRLIGEQAFDLANIVDDLLVAARAEIGSLHISRVSVDLQAQVVQVLEAREQEPAARIEVDGDPVRAWGDPARVRQILRNLLTNALRHGGDRIRVRVSKIGSSAQILVTDNGPGVPEGEREAIFEPYYRSHHTPGQPASVGLGLTVSRKLARLMSGDLTFQRNEGWSIFQLTLPAAPTDQGGDTPTEA